MPLLFLCPNGLTAFKLRTEYPLGKGDKLPRAAGDTAYKNAARKEIRKMEFLKEALGEALYKQVAEKLKGDEKVKLANLAGGEYVAKAKYEAMEAKTSELEKAIGERDKQLETLKASAGSSEALQAQIKELQTQNESTAKEYAEKLKAQERDYALKDALKSEYKAKDVLSVLPHLKQDAILFTDGKFTGLSEQIKELQTSKAFLFEQKGEDVPPGSGGAQGVPPAADGAGTEWDFGFTGVRK